MSLQSSKDLNSTQSTNVVMTFEDIGSKMNFEVLVSQEDVPFIKRDLTFAKAFLEVTKRNGGYPVEKNHYDLSLFDATKSTTYKVKLEAQDYIKAVKDIRISQSILDQIIKSQENNCSSKTANLSQIPGSRESSTSVATKRPISHLLKPVENDNVIQKPECSSTKAKSGPIKTMNGKDDVFNADIIKQFYKENLQNIENINNSDSDEGDNDSATPAKRGKRCEWKSPEIALLLCSYGEHQHLFGINKRQFWKNVHQDLKKHEYDKSVKQIQDKMDKLKREYKSNVDHNKKTGVNRTTIPFYEELDELFRSKPWINIPTVAGSNEKAPSLDRTKPRGSLQDLVQILKQNQEKKQEIEEKKLSLQEKKLEMTQKFLDKKLEIFERKSM